MPGVSVIIITLNEQANIRACLESVAWADEIIVIDSRSIDETVAIAKKYTDKVFVIDWKGYGDTKNFGMSKATCDWVFWVDADERVPVELSKEIRQIVQSKTVEYDAYEVARRAFFIGKWIKHCGWYPGYVTRLFKRKSAKFSSSQVHEYVVFEGPVGRLRNDLLHYTDENLFHYLSKLNKYTSLASSELLQKKKSFGLYDVFVRPPFIFLKMYILRLGFLDGMHGLILSLLSACYVFVKYVKLWELNRPDSEGNNKRTG